jgi:hypothetical protein
MTEEACKALERLREGNPIVCSADAYHREIRDALILFALECADSNDTVRMRIALAEVNSRPRKSRASNVGKTAAERLQACSELEYKP